MNNNLTLLSVKTKSPFVLLVDIRRLDALVYYKINVSIFSRIHSIGFIKNN